LNGLKARDPIKNLKYLKMNERIQVYVSKLKRR
ncbi:MAG: hypothetical protein ACI8RD_002287, partial [Bacillariaceae sp.]